MSQPSKLDFWSKFGGWLIQHSFLKLMKSNICSNKTSLTEKDYHIDKKESLIYNELCSGYVRQGEIICSLINRKYY